MEGSSISGYADLERESKQRGFSAEAEAWLLSRAVWACGSIREAVSGAGVHELDAAWCKVSQHSVVLCYRLGNWLEKLLSFLSLTPPPLLLFLLETKRRFRLFCFGFLLVEVPIPCRFGDASCCWCWSRTHRCLQHGETLCWVPHWPRRDVLFCSEGTALSQGVLW